jgi:hypothetical protein
MPPRRGNRQLVTGGLGAIGILALASAADPARWAQWSWSFTMPDLAWPQWSLPAWLTLDTVAIIVFPLLALAAAALLIALASRSLASRRDAGRRVRRLAGQGIRLPVIARRLGLAQDAVRQLAATDPAATRAAHPGTFFREPPAVASASSRAPWSSPGQTRYEGVA